MDNRQLLKLSLSGLLLLLLLTVGVCQTVDNPTTDRNITISKQNVEVLVADTVLTNGKILTADSDFSIIQALAIKNDRIIIVGNSNKVQEFIGPATQLIDLKGKMVIPGLIDNHMYFIRAIQRWNLQARIDGITSRKEALEKIAGKASEM